MAFRVVLDTRKRGDLKKYLARDPKGDKWYYSCFRELSLQFGTIEEANHAISRVNRGGLTRPLYAERV